MLLGAHGLCAACFESLSMTPSRPCTPGLSRTYGTMPCHAQGHHRLLAFGRSCAADGGYFHLAVIASPPAGWQGTKQSLRMLIN